MAKFVQSSGNVIPGSNRIPGSRHTAASATKALPNTRSEVSAKLRLCQLSTLRRRHSSLIWPFAIMKTGKRMVLSQWSLADTYMCLSAVLVIDMFWIAAWTPHQLATLARHWTSLSNVIPGNARIPGSRQTAASATKQSTQHKVWGVCQAQAFSALHIAKETLFIDLTYCEGADACTCDHVRVCSLFGAGDWCLWTYSLDDAGWTPHRLARLARHWTRASVRASSMAKDSKSCSMLCSVLLRTGTGNVIPGNDWTGSRQKTASATKESSWHKVWGVCQTQALSTFNIAKETFFIDLTLCENKNSGENGSACLPFLQYWWLIWTGLLHERHIKWQERQDIELAQVLVFFRHGKSCSMLCAFNPGQRDSW